MRRKNIGKKIRKNGEKYGFRHKNISMIKHKQKIGRADAAVEDCRIQKLIFIDPQHTHDRVHIEKTTYGSL